MPLATSKHSPSKELLRYEGEALLDLSGWRFVGGSDRGRELKWHFCIFVESMLCGDRDLWGYTENPSKMLHRHGPEAWCRVERENPIDTSTISFPPNSLLLYQRALCRATHQCCRVLLLSARRHYRFDICSVTMIWFILMVTEGGYYFLKSA